MKTPAPARGCPGRSTSVRQPTFPGNSYRPVAISPAAPGDGRAPLGWWLLRILTLLFALPLGASAVVFTSDTLLNPLNTNYDGQDIVVSNATLTVDGAHTFANLLVGPGGTLTHSFSASGSVTYSNSVVDESQLLIGTNDSTLAVSNVIAVTVVVKDISSTITYTNLADYIVTISGNQGFLRRSDTSAIPDGATVLVSYEATAGSAAGLNLTVTNNLEVAAGGAINANARGFGGNTGTGNGGEAGSPQTGAGAGYGGYGGNSSSNAIGGVGYGLFSDPSFLGSGGGQGAGGMGGNGGGLVRLTVSGSALIDGIISANGGDATNSRSGGGAGGSIKLTVQTISGAGAITAHGGAGEPVHGGGGGGGRIAIFCASNDFAGAIVAFGGTGWKIGGAGTVFTKLTVQAGLLLVDNGGRNGTNTPVLISSGENVLVRSNATVLPSGNWSAGNVTVLASAAITADATGSAPGTGSGAGNYYTSDANRPCSGAGHGGNGAMVLTNVNGGVAYDSLPAPTIAGSGGGQFLPTSIGGAGGGVIRLIVSGVLSVEGRISANGGDGSGSGGGGGSGGSVYLTATTLAGNGSITAQGGQAPILYGGGGGGGRIALYLTTNLFAGTVTAYGGVGVNTGGAGTIFLSTNGDVPLVIVDNGSRVGTNTPVSLSGTIDLLVRSNGMVTASGSWTARYVTIASNSLLAVVAPNSTLSVTANRLTIEPTGGVVADGAGYNPATGVGPGGNYAGGGHGGTGGTGATNGFGGTAYGSATGPATLGSGGGNGSNSLNPGGAGGGAIIFNIADTLTVDGWISANGRNSALGGGGAGGSVWINQGTLLGTGSITANGGACAGTIGGGGGGGRVALTPTTYSFVGNVTAYGGGGFVRGGAGTVYLNGRVTSKPSLNQLLLDNGGVFGTNTPLPSLQGSDLIVSNGAVATSSSSLSFNKLLVGTNGVLMPLSGNPTFTFTSVMVEPGGVIHADGMGISSSGPGVGTLVTSGIYYGGGGGHGGYGGQGGNANARGGNTYDSVTAPTSGGSPGGGSGSSFTPFGGMGGGVLRLTVSGSLTNNGRISADGKIGSGTYPGGGSGGSVWLTLGNFYGAGVVSANGGPGILPGGGGGGGGRIAITFNTKPYTGIVSAYGGSGVNYGGSGTVYLKTNSANYGQLTVDNGGNAGTNTTYDSSFTPDLIVSGRGVAVLPANNSTLHNVLIKTNGTLRATTSGSLQTLNLSGNLTIDAGGVFTADGTGFPTGSGTGSGGVGGGGHGGYGALANSSSGAAYGSIQSPITAGSGGGDGSGGAGGGGPSGGAGGGALRLTFGSSGVLTVNGRLSANGLAGTSGGGSGGSLQLSPSTLSGAGIISANGGPGFLPGGGGGGGGRIAITYTSNTFSGNLSAYGGAGAVGGGAGTVYTKPLSQAAGLLLVDNGGLAGTNTPLSSAYTFPGSGFNLTISGGATALALTPLPVLSNLTIAAGSVLTTRTNETNIVIATLADVNIAPGGALVVDGKGFTRAAGTGAGASANSKGAGGGYGGLGGNSQSGAPGGTNYGSAAHPVDRGSGGGAGAYTYSGGSEGGGAIRLSVGGKLNVDGLLTANGTPGLQDDSGGGAGGSIWVTARAVTGSGIISARGGDGELFGGGGGGGGRIAIYSPSNSFAGFTNVSGGVGANTGQVGTLITASVLDGFQVVSVSPTGIVNTTVGAVDFTFNEIVASSSVIATNIKVFTPAGLVPPENVFASANGLMTVHVSFVSQTYAGDYRVEVGPAVSDIFGQVTQPFTNYFTVVVPVISGTVTNADGSPVAGVALQISGGYPVATTAANGQYEFGVNTGWTGTVTPTLGTNWFVPGGANYTNVTGSTNQDYLMLPTIAPLLSSGLNDTNFFFNWSGIPGVTYQPWWSSNLVDWLPLGGPLPGTNGLMQLLVPVSADPMKFLRVNAAN